MTFNEGMRIDTSTTSTGAVAGPDGVSRSAADSADC